MADDRWRNDRDGGRFGGGERGRQRESYDRHEPDGDRDQFSRVDHEGFGRGMRGGGFGRGSRDFPGGRENAAGWGSREHGVERPGRGWEDDTRAQYGRSETQRELGRGSWGGGSGPDERGDRYYDRDRSVGELAFGRDQSGRYRSDDRDFRRERDGSERGWFDRVGDEVASWFGSGDDEERIRRLDLRERGGEHRGRGPKGYQRSDQRILEDINDRLTDDSRLDASEIDVGVAGREVTLTGTVFSRSDKRRAEDIADAVSGVTHVQNNLRVRDAGTSWSDPGSRDATDPAGVNARTTPLDAPKTGE